jgi:hypothetical protein
MQGEGEREGHIAMRLLSAIPAAAVALAVCVGTANAGCPKEWADPPAQQRKNPLTFLGDGLQDFGARMNPERYVQLKREEAARATYRALLQAGATEEVACAAALNPDFFRIVAPQYLRPQR